MSLLSDTLSLMAFELLAPLPVIANNQNAALPMKIIVACTEQDCSGRSAGNNNFDFNLFLDEDLGIQGDETALVNVGSATVLHTGGNPLQSDLS